MKQRIPCLSVRQPWAWLLIHGHKPIENRNWRPYDGFLNSVSGTRLVIHAAKKFEENDYWMLREKMPEIRMPEIPQFRRQALAGSITLLDVSHRNRFENWKADNHIWVNPDSEYHWLFHEPRRFTPEIRLKGEPFIFWIDPQILQRHGLLGNRQVSHAG